MKKIIDEFTDQPLDRRRKYQLRLRKEGRCPSCGHKLRVKEVKVKR